MGGDRGAPASADHSSTGARRSAKSVVTAERRSENLQATPVAVSAFLGRVASSSKLDGGQNLLLQIPDTNYTRSNFGGYNFKIRGIGTDVTTFGGTSGVSINENELPVLRQQFRQRRFLRHGARGSLARPRKARSTAATQPAARSI